jgi:peroxiredoxin
MLLSDSDHDVAHLYGTDQHAMGSLYASRKTFLIDEQGIIKAILENVTPETHANDVLKVFGFNA